VSISEPSLAGLLARFLWPLANAVLPPVSTEFGRPIPVPRRRAACKIVAPDRLLPRALDDKMSKSVTRNWNGK
jgi:hypothetical protein